jgi:hypothetical protein
MHNLTNIYVKCQNKVDLLIYIKKIEIAILEELNFLVQSGDLSNIKQSSTYEKIYQRFVNQDFIEEKDFKKLFTKLAGDAVNECLFLSIL